MENDFVHPLTEPPPQHKLSWQGIKHIIRKHLVLFSLSVVALIGMTTYIFVAPAEEQTLVTAAPQELPTPTPSITLTPTMTPPPTIPLPTVTPQPTFTPTPTIPPGTSWKTYANTKYGYRIKYSPDWVVKDLGELEPKIPSYVNFHPASASESSRLITIGVTTRTYEEQLALGASSSAITVAGIKGTKQFFQDSDGNTSTVVILPRPTHLIVLRAKTAYLTYFELMLSTLYVAK